MLDTSISSGLDAVIVIFSMSLFGSYVLFKILKATAVIKNEKFQAGGALAGFIILYVTMFQSYQPLRDAKDTENKLAETRALLANRTIKGSLIPNLSNTKIILATQQTDTDSEGKFKLLTKCINPDDDDIKVYVISANGSFVSRRLSSMEQMDNFNITTTR